MSKNSAPEGIILCVLASLAWGGLAVAVQFMFEFGGMKAAELSAIRLVTAGALFVIVGFAFRVRNFTFPFKSVKYFVRAAICGVLIYFAHLTFFLSVYYSNAGSGAIYLATTPLIASVWLAMTERRPLKAYEAAAVLVVIAGVSLVVTDGDFSRLKFSPLSIFWGLASAVCSVAYALYPRRLMFEEGVTPVVSWSMFFGGIAASIVSPPWLIKVSWTLPMALDFAYIVLFGTMFAFWCYLKSLTLISPVHATMIGTVEPASAFVFGAILFTAPVGPWQTLGVVVVLATVLLFSLRTAKTRAEGRIKERARITREAPRHDR